VQTCVAQVTNANRVFGVHFFLSTLTAHAWAGEVSRQRESRGVKNGLYRLAESQSSNVDGVFAVVVINDVEL
jgi:hypothetical protein